MKPWPVVLLALLLIAGCRSGPARSGDRVDSFPAGTYMWDDLAPHASATIRFSSSHAYSLHGTLSSKNGTAVGRWELEGDQIILRPKAESGSFAGFARRFRIDEHRENVVVLVAGETWTERSPGGGAAVYPSFRRTSSE